MGRDSEAFIRTASVDPGEAARVVRFSASEFIGVEVPPAMLVPLRKRYPRLIVEVALSNTAADHLEQEVDVAVHAPASAGWAKPKFPMI